MTAGILIVHESAIAVQVSECVRVSVRGIQLAKDRDFCEGW
jgi:hypothetical protein